MAVTSMAHARVASMPVATAHPSPATGDERKSTLESVIEFGGDMFAGAGQGVVDLGESTAHMVMHPIETLKSLARLPVTIWTRPGDVGRAIVEPYVDAWQEGHPGRAIGRGIVEFGVLILSPKVMPVGARALVNLAGKSSHASAMASVAGKVAFAASFADDLAAASVAADRLIRIQFVPPP